MRLPSPRRVGSGILLTRIVAGKCDIFNLVILPRRHLSAKRERSPACCGKIGPAAGTKQREFDMAGTAVPHFQNDAGHSAIEVGVKEFMCVGATPPQDHPHVFLDMGSDSELVCPYCSTLYRYTPELKATETRPDGCLYVARAA
jgi:uncharacterized Zn-finger protein